MRRLATITAVHHYTGEQLSRAVAFLERSWRRVPFDELVGATHPLAELDDALAEAATGRYVRVASRRGAGPCETPGAAPRGGVTWRPVRGSMGMISRELALALRDAGLVWHPASGDRFQLDLPDDVEAEAEADVFTVSEMTIEARRYPTGTILAFNGTTEWALDSVAFADAVWLPREDQLRELLRATFRVAHAARRRVRGRGRARWGAGAFDHPDVAEAYGLALLELVGRSR